MMYSNESSGDGSGAFSGDGDGSYLRSGVFLYCSGGCDDDRDGISGSSGLASVVMLVIHSDSGSEYISSCSGIIHSL